MSVQFGVLSRRLPMDYGRKPHNEPMRFDVRMGVKTEKAQCEHMFSALPLRTDIEQCSRHVRLVPTGDVARRRGRQLRGPKRKNRRWRPRPTAALMCAAPESSFRKLDQVG